MAATKYATEDNIRSLITLIRDELSNYVTKEEFGSSGPSSGSSGSTTTTSPGFTIEILDTIDGQTGKPGIIYLVNRGAGESVENQYNEYIWMEDDNRFELLGPASWEYRFDSFVRQTEFEEAIEDIRSGAASLRIEKVYALPDTGEPGIIYLLYQGGEDPVNQYVEYVWVSEDGQFEELGPVTITNDDLEEEPYE